MKTLALQSGKFKTFLIESCFGLQGNETLRAYPCVLDEVRGTFFVWLADTDLAAFTKHTFMNLCDFAEDNMATDVIFLIDRNHAQRHEYKRMFRVIDAIQLDAEEASVLIRKDPGSSDEDESEDSGAEAPIKNVHEAVTFYKFAL